MEQCTKRNTKLQHSAIFDIADGDELYISSIDSSQISNYEWILNQQGRLNVIYCMPLHIRIAS